MLQRRALALWDLPVLLELVQFFGSPSRGGRRLTAPPVLHPTRLFLSEGSRAAPIGSHGDHRHPSLKQRAQSPRGVGLAEWGHVAPRRDALTREEADTTQEDIAHPS